MELPAWPSWGREPHPDAEEDTTVTVESGSGVPAQGGLCPAGSEWAQGLL